MSKYANYFNMCVRSMLAYKADYFLYMAINTVFFYISIALWLTIYKVGGVDQINSYTISNTITYYLLTTLIFRFDMVNVIYLGNEIWTGKFTNDYIKPWNVTFIHFIASVADIFMGLLTFVPFLLIMYFSSSWLITLPSAQNVLLFIITMILAMVMNFFFNLIFHALTFHYGDRRSLIELINFIISFLAGSMFPLAFLSGTIKDIFLALPFKYLFYIPIETFLGKMTSEQIIRSWPIIITWSLIFFGVYRVVFLTGIKKYEGTGR
ncbi:MAG: hypothetical protein BWY19_00504 [bacterium ADurb.Bin212]|nr:MAG: hypothetical protein BWY19_00504 [bacterium ADurb.Bin212]